MAIGLTIQPEGLDQPALRPGLAEARRLLQLTYRQATRRP